MGITVPNYNTSNLNPGVFLGVTNINANQGGQNQPTLIIGQKLSTGTATANVPVLSQGQAIDAAAFGANSMLAQMIKWYRKGDAQGTVWVLPLADNNAGTATTVTLTVTGPATAAGTLSVYIAGQLVQVAVSNGDTAAVIAANLVAACTALGTLPCTAAASAAVVTLTAIHKGAAAGDIDTRLNYRGSSNGEATPAGVAVAIATTPGATDPDLAAALANMTTMPADFIVTPYSGSANIVELESFLADTGSGRWNPEVMIFGHAFGAVRGTLGADTTFGASNNNQHIEFLPFYDGPDPAYNWAANHTAYIANIIRQDPGLGIVDVSLDVLAPPVQSRFTFDERNTLLYDGLSTYVVDQSNTVRLSRVVTTYQFGAFGQPDSSYRNINIPYGLMYIIRQLLTDLSVYLGLKIVDNGNNISFGQNLVRPQDILNGAIASYNRLCAQGYAQNPKQFAQNAQVSYTASTGAVFLSLPVNLVGQVYILAGTLPFILT